MQQSVLPRISDRPVADEVVEHPLVFAPRLPLEAHRDPMWTPDLSIYDRYVVLFSGGKDSVACVLRLLELGVPREAIELHHHDVDGQEGSNLMDWPITRDYCRAFARALGLKLIFSWKVGGFEREMLRQDSLTSPIAWESESGQILSSGGTRGKANTRQMFPQVTADLTQRWCSGYLKVDVGARVLTSEPRFTQGKTLVLSGERAEESSARARYQVFEHDRSDNREGKRVVRHIDHWRAVHAWDEQQVWDIIQRHGINAHPAYHLGWGRTSCMKCIFGSANQWASVRLIDPQGFEEIALYEERFGKTIHRQLSVRDLAARGTPYDMDPAVVSLALGEHYPQEQILVDPAAWKLPQGAFGESNGPT